jgi:hypothetical protein
VGITIFLCATEAGRDCIEVINVKSGNHINNDTQLEVPVVEEASIGRRKLIRSGMIGVPVLLALKSTPVLACNCKLPSGFSTSGNLSRNGGATCNDPAHAPTYWKTKYSGNPQKFSGTTLATSTKFSDVFGGTDTRTFLTVLGSGSNLASLVVAAYIGIKANYFVSGISIANIISMWQGTYRPTAGAPLWNNVNSENYLRYVMGLPLL